MSVSRYRFADVEFDVDRFVVTRGGQRVVLEPKAMDVLRALVERPGRLVSKDELLDLVWPGVAVTPNALTRVVAQLRRALGDDASAARLIETVPTRGYRFIATVEAMEASAAPPAATAIVTASVGDVVAAESGAPTAAAVTASVSAAAAAVSSGRPSRAGVVAGALLLAAAIASAWFATRGVASSPAQSRVTPIADETGSILDAAYSPDGRRLAVVSDRSGDFEIYVRDLEAGTSRPLTADGMRNVHPSWSPDSSRLAYHSAQRKGIWTIAVAGGAARQLSTIGSRPSWSPDGQWIAFQSDEWVGELAQPGSHLLLVAADGSTPPHALTEAGDPPGGHGAPFWAPDGTSIYFTATRNGPTDYWSVRVRDGILTKRADDWAMRVLGLTNGPTGVLAWGMDWRASGGRLLRAGVGDGVGPNGVPEVVVDGLPGGVRAGTLAPGGRTAALVLVDISEGIWTVPVTASGAPSGPATEFGPGNHPAISPDGQYVAYDLGRQIRVKRLDGTGERTILDGGRRAMYPTWRDERRLYALRFAGLSTFLVEADLETGEVRERVRLPDATSFPRLGPDGDTIVATLGEPLNQVGRGSLGAGTFEAWRLFDGFAFPVWSPDGRRLALERKEGRHMPAYLADVSTGTTRRVSPAEGQFWPGSFSPDGRRLAMSVLEQPGIWNVETLDLETGARVAVTHETSPERPARYPSWSPRGGVMAYNRQFIRGRLHLVDLTPDAPSTTR